MASEPYPDEPVYAPDFEQLVANICRAPGSYVIPDNFHSVCNFLVGYDVARNGGPLQGIRPFLVVRFNGGNNLHWSGLAHHLLQSQPGDADLPDGQREVRALGRLLAEFFEYRRTNGLTKIFYEYGKWLLRHKWYDGPLRKNAKA